MHRKPAGDISASIDYDVPQFGREDEFTQMPEGPESGKAADVIDLEEAGLADTYELPGADLSGEELLIDVVPVQFDEFTCMFCFLVYHRSQVAREEAGRKYCSECEG